MGWYFIFLWVSKYMNVSKNSCSKGPLSKRRFFKNNQNFNGHYRLKIPNYCIFSYSNSPFYWTANPNAKPYVKESIENRTSSGSRSKMDKNGNGSETRKQKRTRVQKELEDYKISHRLGVLRYRLQIIDSESDIIRNEIRSLEKTLSGQ